MVRMDIYKMKGIAPIYDNQLHVKIHARYYDTMVGQGYCNLYNYFLSKNVLRNCFGSLLGDAISLMKHVK